MAFHGADIYYASYYQAFNRLGDMEGYPDQALPDDIRRIAASEIAKNCANCGMNAIFGLALHSGKFKDPKTILGN